MVLNPKPHFPPAIKATFDPRIRVECRLVGTAELRQVGQHRRVIPILEIERAQVRQTALAQEALRLF